MATLIVEVQSRGLNHYHRLEKFPVTIGRAFDNDIILSDSSVAPHHIELEKIENDIIRIKKIDTASDTFLNKHELGVQSIEVPIPSQITLGTRKLRVLSSTMAVDSAQTTRCRGLFSPLCSPIWSGFLLALTIVSFVLNNYLDVTTEKGVLFYLSNLLPNLLAILAFSLVISGITRLVAHRWKLIPALNVATLFTLIPLVLFEIGHLADYFFTSDTVSNWLLTLNDFVLLPLLLFLFLWRVNHQRVLPAMGIALLLSSPLLAYQVINLVDQASTNAEFSAEPTYNQTLSSMNVHMGTARSIDDFVEKASSYLPNQVNK